jgi:hypothetical protein
MSLNDPRIGKRQIQLWVPEEPMKFRPLRDRVVVKRINAKGARSIP